MKTMFVLLLAALALIARPLFAEEFSVDNDGFIRNWLVLAPIPYAGRNNGAEEIHKAQVKDEGKLKPTLGEKVSVGDEKLEWKMGKAETFYFDFNTWLKQPPEDKAENFIGYLYCIIMAPDEMPGLEARLGSNDQGRLYLNGKEIFLSEKTRPISKDEDTARNVTLQKGENPIVFKIINEGNDWQACLRFTDKNGTPINNLKILLPSK